MVAMIPILTSKISEPDLEMTQSQMLTADKHGAMRRINSGIAREPPDYTIVGIPQNRLETHAFVFRYHAHRVETAKGLSAP